MGLEMYKEKANYSFSITIVTKKVLEYHNYFYFVFVFCWGHGRQVFVLQKISEFFMFTLHQKSGRIIVACQKQTTSSSTGRKKNDC